ncbi:MAG: hypothetical protein Kow001_07960 [Acidobacteriota bacterium]
MDPVIALVLQHLRVSHRLYRKALADLSLEELHRRPGPDSSPLIWIFGHLASARCGMLQLAGGSLEFPWPELFRRGSRIVTPQDYPEVNEIAAVWDQAGAALEERLPRLSLEDLAAPAPRKFPVEDPSVRAALAFLTYHEAYHVGQLSYLRRILGREGLAG